MAAVRHEQTLTASALVSWVKPLHHEYPQQDLMRVEHLWLVIMEYLF